MSFATKGAPQGWLECSGQLVSIRSYPNLFQVLGTTWGGDGVNNFVIPNLNNGQFIRGGGREVDATFYYDSTSKPSGLSLILQDIGGHTHTAYLEVGSDTVYSAWQNVDPRAFFDRLNHNDSMNYDVLVEPVGNHTHNVIESGWDTETAPKHVVLLYCIKY